MRALVVACVALAAQTQVAAAVSLRAQSTLDGPEVRIADLFDDAGAAGDRVLGPAPAPGSRLTIEAAQLAAIARQFAVDWRPATGGERVVLDRPGRPLAQEEVRAALRGAVSSACGSVADCDIELPAFAPPMIPSGTKAQVDVQQIDVDGASGRFSALLVVSGARMAPITQRVAGRVQQMVEVAVPTRRIMPGEVLGAGDVRLGRVRGGSVRIEVAQLVGDAVGMQARHTLTGGQPIPLADIARPYAVAKGANVVMTLDGAGISVTAMGQALEPGPMGGHIRVLNTASRAIVEAQVSGPDQVRVDIPSRQMAAR